jgi:hypothetical protein
MLMSDIQKKTLRQIFKENLHEAWFGYLLFVIATFTAVIIYAIVRASVT